MEFDDYCQVYLEEAGKNVLFILEDDPMRLHMMVQFVRKFRPDVQVENSEMVPSAITYISQNSNQIFAYSLDYNLKGGENGSKVAEYIASLGNTGHNVWIHSDDPEGVDVLKQILPDAHVQQAPSNILEIVKM